MFKLAILAALLVGSVCAQSDSQPEKANLDEVPLANVPLAGPESAPAGSKLKGDLVNLAKSLHAGAGRAIEEAKPSLNEVHNDLLESYEHLKQNPHVQAASQFAKPRIEYAKNKVVPLYQQGKGKLTNLVSKTAHKVHNLNAPGKPSPAPVAPAVPVRPEGAEEQEQQEQQLIPVEEPQVRYPPRANRPSMSRV